MPKMMNLSVDQHHKILGCHQTTAIGTLSALRASALRSEGGYTLVALLALMSVVALFAMAVAPSLQQQALRDREKEAIFRGEQVADAIRDYYKYRATFNSLRGDQALPTSMDQLLQGLPIPGGSKSRQILRATAARDPLTLEGEWRFIHPRSEELIEFQQAVYTYAGTVLPGPRNDQQMAQLQQFAVPQITTLLNTGTTAKSTGSSSAGDDSSGPFVGVASRSRRSSVLTFYGIESHDGWIFTPLFRN
jgi:type II secretory pathway pseudopilin PulG